MPGKADAAREKMHAQVEKRLARIVDHPRRQRDARLLLHPKNVQRRAENIERSNMVLQGRIDDLEERLEKLEKKK